MGLFHKHKTTLVEITSIISRLRQLSLDLQKHYKIYEHAKGSNDELTSSSRIYANSGLADFIARPYVVNSTQYDIKSFNYSVNQVFGHILSIWHSKDLSPESLPLRVDPKLQPERISSETDQVIFKLFDTFSLTDYTRFEVLAIMPETVWRKKYSQYGVGDAFHVHGLVCVDYYCLYGPFLLENQPESCFMNFVIKVFIN